MTFLSRQDYTQRISTLINRSVTTDVSSRLIGDHQAGNAETAIAAAVQLKAQGLQQITDESMAKGLAAVSLSGRFQVDPNPTPLHTLEGNAWHVHNVDTDTG